MLLRRADSLTAHAKRYDKIGHGHRAKDFASTKLGAAHEKRGRSAPPRPGWEARGVSGPSRGALLEEQGSWRLVDRQVRMRPRGRGARRGITRVRVVDRL